MITLSPMLIAGGVLIASVGVQTVRLHIAQGDLRAAEQNLRTCSARVANMELRRRVEDDTSAVPDPLGELRRDFSRPN